jgi:choline-sulfatase
LLISGPGVSAGGVVSQIASHVDLFPTVVEALGASLASEDADLPGVSLWPAVGGQDTDRLGFAEFHAQSSKTAGYLLRDGKDKLVYHVNMPRQHFDLEADPQETNDLAISGGADATADALEAKLREMLDPEAVNQRAMADQLAHADRHGGVDAVRDRGTFSYTPVPGDDLNLEKVG